MQRLIDRGLHRNRLKDFLQRSVEEYQDLVCEYMNAHVVHKEERKATLHYYQSEFNFYKNAYQKAERKGQEEFSKDLDSYAQIHGIRQEQLKERIQKEVEREIEQSWRSFKSNKYTSDDIFDYYEARNL
ncbi:MAG: hypothetical protein ACOYL6_14950 [Bacteriovoracaceae bacterium]